jgi:hypothetical protein
MRFVEEIRGGLRGGAGWRLCLKACCALLLGVACLSLHGGLPADRLSGGARGLSEAPFSDGAGQVCLDASSSACDAVLKDSREDDPFLAFLALRSSFVPGPCPYIKTPWPLAERPLSLARTAPPDAEPFPLDRLAASLQLLC